MILREKKTYRMHLIFIYGAQGRNRTGTVLPPRDFKSLASTNFATWASGWAYFINIFYVELIW